MDENMVKLLQERERELYVLGIKREIPISKTDGLNCAISCDC